MTEQAFDIAKLIIRRLNGELDAAGDAVLDSWLACSEDHQTLFDAYQDKEWLVEQWRIMDGMDQQAAWASLLDKLPALRPAEW